MEPTDLTIEILKAIRDETQATRAELKVEVGGLRAEIVSLREETNARLDAMGRRIVESEMRTATAVVDLHGTVRDLVDVLRAQQDVRPRVDRCERDILDIKHRLGM